jgi:hypothetical protein
MNKTRFIAFLITFVISGVTCIVLDLLIGKDTLKLALIIGIGGGIGAGLGVSLLLPKILKKIID